MQRILVIRGGAIGDFILTLPALKLLRDKFPSAHIEILGYKHIVALAENRFYANATRSIDYAPLSRFFARDAELPEDLVEYFSGFDLVVSYLFDPDEVFAANLRRCNAARLILARRSFSERDHAARQLAEPLAELGLHLADASAVLFPNDEDRNAAIRFLQGHGFAGDRDSSRQRNRKEELADRELDRPRKLFVRREAIKERRLPSRRTTQPALWKAPLLGGRIW